MTRRLEIEIHPDTVSYKPLKMMWASFRLEADTSDVRGGHLKSEVSK